MSELVEEWKWIIGYEGMYQVSNLGRVKSMKFGKEKILKPALNGLIGNQYLFVCLSKNKISKLFTIHKLVCQAFNDDYFIGCGKDVNHIDGNKLNNKSENLEPRTRRENTSGVCYRKNQNKFTSQYNNVSWNKKYNKWHSSILYNSKTYFLGFFKYEEEIEAYKLSQIALSHINNGTFEIFILQFKHNNNISGINQYSMNGDFIREWKTISEAAKVLKINRSNICHCCKSRQKTAGGFIWKYKED